MFFKNFNRSEVKQSGWFTSSKTVQDEMTEERKAATPTRSSRRITVTPRAVHRPTRLPPPPPSQPAKISQPTHFASRTVNPTPRTVTYTSREIKLYTKNDDQQETSQMMLPPTTTELVVKKPVRYISNFFTTIIDICINFTSR